MVSPLLIQAGLPVLLTVVGEALSRIDHPAAKIASQSLGNVTGALGRGQITQEQIEEANRHAEAMAAMQSAETKAAYEQVNTSLRSEIASDDVYVRRMRPTFGYLMAFTWTAQMLGLGYVMTFRTEQAPIVLNAMESLAAIWAMGLSVLGIYVYKRSEEKRVGAGGILPAALSVAQQPAPTESEHDTAVQATLKTVRVPYQFNN